MYRMAQMFDGGKILTNLTNQNFVVKISLNKSLSTSTNGFHMSSRESVH